MVTELLSDKQVSAEQLFKIVLWMGLGTAKYLPKLIGMEIR